ncbi:MAG: ribokinase [Lachnospiraceae bacterium]|nr:ribokinase [Lachnospiraceae bacterium]
MYDIMIIGQMTLDHNTDYDGREEFRTGGAVTFSGYAAAAIGHSVAVVPKGDPAVIDPYAAFADSRVEKIFPVYSPTCTVMENTYFTPDRERRRCLNTSSIVPYAPEDLPEEEARIYHLGGLVNGDMGADILEACARRGDTALDVQAVLRCRNEDGSLELRDWPDKLRYLPLIRFLKTDAAEAEVLTGTDDREKAAFLLCEWGAKEVLITHNTEALVCDGTHIFRAPLKPRNLSGRTGRGDTTFAGYLTERLGSDIPAALEYAAPLVSLKMETPGPFTGTRQDVLDYIEQFYR